MIKDYRQCCANYTSLEANILQATVADQADDHEQGCNNTNLQGRIHLPQRRQHPLRHIPLLCCRAAAATTAAARLLLPAAGCGASARQCESEGVRPLPQPRHVFDHTQNRDVRLQRTVR